MKVACTAREIEVRAVIRHIDYNKVFESVRSYQKFEAKLSRLQYLNRHQKVGSANWRAAQLKIAKLHGKIANIRHDALHKLTTYLAKVRLVPVRSL